MARLDPNRIAEALQDCAGIVVALVFEQEVDRSRLIPEACAEQQIDVCRCLADLLERVGRALERAPVDGGCGFLRQQSPEQPLCVLGTPERGEEQAVVGLRRPLLKASWAGAPGA